MRVLAVFLIICAAAFAQNFTTKEETLYGRCVIKSVIHHGEKIQGTYVRTQEEDVLIVGLKSYDGLKKFKGERIAVKGKSILFGKGLKNIQISSDKDVTLQKPVNLTGWVEKKKKQVFLRLKDQQTIEFLGSKCCRAALKFKGKEVGLCCYLGKNGGIDEIVSISKIMARVLLLSGSQGFDPEIHKQIQTGLQKKGCAVKTASLGEDPLDFSPFQGIVICGSFGKKELNQETIDRLTGEAHKKVIGAICSAPASVLGALGILKNKKATGDAGVKTFELMGAIYVDKPVVRDGRIITAKGQGCKRFIRVFIGALK